MKLSCCQNFKAKCCLPLFAIALIFLNKNTLAQVQVPVFGSQHLINGYAKSLQGEVIPYFSVYPKFAKQALLTRCTDGKKWIEWETDVIPAGTKGNYAYFIWIAAHSTGTSGGKRNFDLYINDHYALTFTTYPNEYKPYWTFGASDSTRLVFEYKTKDGANDAHGLAYLRVPLSKYKKDKPIRIKVAGQNQQSNDWYMTFAYTFKEKIEIKTLPFLLKGNLQNKQPIQVTVLHFGAPGKLNITLGDQPQKPFAVQNGFNVFEAYINKVQQQTPLHIKANVGKLSSLDTTVQLHPVTYREIDLIHHSHTDIGYSNLQQEVIKIHNENIRRALHLIEKTKSYPEGSRFVWNIESAWAAENFLQQATQKEKQAFFNAVKNKQIFLSATYANILTGLSTPEEMNWITEFARNLRSEKGLPINAAMMSDIPGMSWSMVSSLAKNGIRYFSNGPNYIEGLPGNGDRIGSTIVEMGNKAYWWKSASGKDSILLWTCGKGYSSWHGTPEGGVAGRAVEKIAGYLDELDTLHYPYDMVQWRYNIVSDNGPTDSTVSDFVKEWNEKYASPKLVLAGVTDMFERFEKKYGKQIPSITGDFTPYWEDGAYSTAKEETDNRMLSEKLEQLEKLAFQKNISIRKEWFYEARKNIVLFHEHTWGAWCSISKPDDPFTTAQWEYKKGFLDSAKYYVDRIEQALKEAIAKPNSITVLNTLPWNRSGYVEVSYPSSFNGNALTDENGKAVIVQKLPENKLVFYASEVPAGGEKSYRFSDVKEKEVPLFQSTITYNIDSITGALKTVNTQNKQWTDSKEFPGLLQAIYVNGRNPNIHSLTSVKNIELVENGPLLKQYRIACNMEGANEVVYEISQYNAADYVKLSVEIDKKAIREKESVHVAFPFSLPEPTVRIGMGDEYFIPGKDQTPGANKDFFSVQRWIDVSNANDGVTICSPQGALFEIGKIENEELVSNGYKRWERSVSPASDLFLYAMNNYWHTNFKIDQDGKTRFDCYLLFHKGFNAAAANHFGYEMTQPLIGISQ